ncbi:MAG: hypothetical protein R3264_04795 [Anaerolineae bacterium]|nr:hypothetical protein [Anaerolineae bacterium]
MKYLFGVTTLLLLLTACTTPQANVGQQASSLDPAVSTATLTKPAPTGPVPEAVEPTATRLPPSPTSIPATPTNTPTPGPTATPTATPLPAIRQISEGTCCTGIYWNAESTEVRFIDRPSATESVGVWGIDITRLGSRPRFVTGRLGTYSQDRSLVAYPDRERGLAIIERLADGQTWEVDTAGSRPSFTPNNRLIWTVFDDDVPWRADSAEVWLADADGSNQERLITLERGSPTAWYSDDELLVSSRIEETDEILLSIVSLSDGSIRKFATLPDVRSAVFSPDRRYLIFMRRFEEDQAENGLWLMDFQDRSPEPKPLPFFGAYRWRDSRHLIYIPFDLQAEAHIFYEYDVETAQSRRLTPDHPLAGAIKIANNEWRISPDGTKIALVATRNTELNGIWVVEIGAP